MSEQLKRHPLAIAWDEWLVGEEGSCSADPATLGLSGSHRKYIESRLHRAFDAGASASFSETDKKLLNEIWEYFDDTSLAIRNLNFSEPLKRLIERLNAN